MADVRVGVELFDADRPIQGADRMAQHAQGVLVDLHGRVAAWTTDPPSTASLVTPDTIRLWCVDGGVWKDIVAPETAGVTGTPAVVTGLPVPGGSALRVTNTDYVETAENTQDAQVATDGAVVITLFRAISPATGTLCSFGGVGAAADESVLTRIKYSDGFYPAANDGDPTWADMNLLDDTRYSAGAGVGAPAWWIAVHRWFNDTTTDWHYWVAPLDRSRTPIIRSGSRAPTNDTATLSRVWRVGGDGCPGDVALIQVMEAGANWLAAVDAIRAHITPWLQGLQHAHAGLDGLTPGESHGWSPLADYESVSAVVVATGARTVKIRCSDSGDAQVWVTPLNAPGGLSRLPYAVNTFDGSGTDDWEITVYPGRWLVQVTGPAAAWHVRT